MRVRQCGLSRINHTWRVLRSVASETRGKLPPESADDQGVLPDEQYETLRARLLAQITDNEARAAKDLSFPPNCGGSMIDVSALH